MGVWSLDWEDPLEEGVATHTSILAWRIPWTEETGRLWTIGLQSQTWLKQLSMHACMHALSALPIPSPCFLDRRGPQWSQFHDLSRLPLLDGAHWKDTCSEAWYPFVNIMHISSNKLGLASAEKLWVEEKLFLERSFLYPVPELDQVLIISLE